MHARSGLPIMRDFYGIARRVDGEIVAAFGFDSFQPQGCQLHLCVDTPSGISRELLKATFRTAFIQWNFAYLVAIIQQSNHKSLNMALRLGFKECGAVPGQLWFGVMHRQDCRWLKLSE
jgi:RimJ/RimL family protein N-acetyltransferase